MSLQGAERSLKKGFASIVPWVVNFQKNTLSKDNFCHLALGSFLAAEWISVTS